MGGFIMHVPDDFAFKEINEKLLITHTHLHYLKVYLSKYGGKAVYI